MHIHIPSFLVLQRIYRIPLHYESYSLNTHTQSNDQYYIA